VAGHKHGARKRRQRGTDADLPAANFRQSNLRNAGFQRTNLEDADLSGADLSEADFSGATLTNADLSNTNLAHLRWRDIRSLKNANIYGVKNAPEGFVSRVFRHGGVQIDSDAQWQASP
jgi:uncharacterized protein YjbI with pentapeptide repeats